MPIRNCLFDGIYARVPIRISNPITKKFVFSHAILDSGADRCAIPIDIAIKLGYELPEKEKGSVFTGLGDTAVYCLNTTLEIFHPNKRPLTIIFIIEHLFGLPPGSTGGFY